MSNQLNLEQALKDLDTEGALLRECPTRTSAVITSLRLSSISKRTAVFQPRSLEGFLSEDEEFIRDLVKVLKNSGGKPMDPITVWYGGRNYYVIDGHHRLEAYKRYWGENCREKEIPCTEFTGSLVEAMEFAGHANHKNKLPMRQDMRMNFAWRLVCVSDLTAGRIVDASGVALRTVRSMRAKLRERLDKDKPDDATSHKRQLGEQAWKDIRDDREKTDLQDWEKRDLAEANRMARRLSREFGSRLHSKAHILAQALVILDSKMPMLMVGSEAWSDHREQIRAFVEDEYELEEIEEQEESENDQNAGTKVYIKKRMEF